MTNPAEVFPVAANRILRQEIVESWATAFQRLACDALETIQVGGIDTRQLRHRIRDLEIIVDERGNPAVRFSVQDVEGMSIMRALLLKTPSPVASLSTNDMDAIRESIGPSQLSGDALDIRLSSGRFSALLEQIEKYPPPVLDVELLCEMKLKFMQMRPTFFGDAVYGNATPETAPVAESTRPKPFGLIGRAVKKLCIGKS